MPKPVTVDLLHPTVVRAFTNWGYISFFGCIAALITLLFFAIGQLKQADDSRRQVRTSSAPETVDALQKEGNLPVATSTAIGSIAPSERAGWFTYTNNRLGFSIQYPAAIEPTIEENDQYNRLTVFGGLPSKTFEVRLKRDTDPDIGVLYGYLDATVVSKDVQLGGVAAYKAVNPEGYADMGGRGLPFVEFVARHAGDVYRLAFYGDAEVSSEELQILSTFRFLD